MMSLFDFVDYKKFIQQAIAAKPKKGHGQLRKLAEFLNVHTTFVSQVINGNKSFNPEQGLLVAEYFGLNDLETQYFVKLIQIERAGTEKYRKLLLKEMDRIRDQSEKIMNRLTIKKVLPDEQKAVFYSDWYYSAVRLLVGIEGYQDMDAISDYLGLERKTVSDVLNFLLDAGLLVRADGILKVGPSKTHIESESPFIKLHHLNWRYKALEYVRSSNREKLHYSSPMTVGKKDVGKIREEIVSLIEKVGKIVDPAPNEELMCLNIDWFKIQGQR